MWVGENISESESVTGVSGVSWTDNIYISLHLNHWLDTVYRARMLMLYMSHRVLYITDRTIVGNISSYEKKTVQSVKVKVF